MVDSFESRKYTFHWFIERFEQARDRALAFGQPISEDLFVTRPAEGVWSVAECYSHLCTFGEEYMKRIQDGFENMTENSVTDSNQAFRPRLIWRGVIKLFEPPYNLKFKTFKPFHPAGKADLDKEQVLQEFLGLQDRLRDKIKTAEAGQIDLNGVKVSNPLLTFVKMTLSECFAVVEAHQRRHMWQAENILDKVRSL